MAHRRKTESALDVGARDWGARDWGARCWGASSLVRSWGWAIASQTSLGVALLLSGAAIAQAATHTLSESNPTLEIQGTSGGSSLVSDCSAQLSGQPSQEIVLTETFIQKSGFLKFTLEASGSPVLVLDGPAGRFCALGDSNAQQNPEVSGYWLPGTYRVYVGDRARASQSYKLWVN